MNNKFFTIALIAVMVFTSTSCKKLLNIDPPSNERPSSVVFGSSETAMAALSGAYSGMTQSQTYSLNLTLINALAADEMVSLSGATRYNVLQNNTYEAQTSSLISDIWADSYTSIYQFNSIIAGLNNNTVVPQTLAKQITGEALAMRAYCYMQLANLFGDVPLVLSTDITETALLPKTPFAAVYAQIILDLRAAKANLAEAYVTNGLSGSRLQVNKSAASALLAKAYLQVGNWQNAVTNASEVIDRTDLYTLLPGNQLGNVFLVNSREAILQLGSALSATSGYTNEGQEFVSSPSSFSVRFSLTPALLRAFEPGDLRRTAWIKEVTLNGVTAQQPFKYQNYNFDSATQSTRTEAPTVLRLAEMYLLRAEANVALGNNANAIADLNTIRLRAGISPLPAGSDLADAVVKERRIEFFCERGDRWLSLRRSRTIDAVMALAKPGTWRSFAQLYPIPQTAIDANPNLTQNQGYR
ncbi:RagB/SusD family nutrient uptake outer membrane protein [Pedobacter petrophilus]|nr:RagB/SusD family nutrient uptake outer membrane protein [Pedobacter petrophilus]